MPYIGPANVRAIVVSEAGGLVPKKACLGPGKGARCPVGALTESGRCSSCSRAVDRARGTRQQRGYDADHDALRADYQRRMDAGQAFGCWRCGRDIDPTDWTLGHCDDDRRRYHGPECGGCNYATSSRREAPCPHPTHPSTAA